MNVLPSSSGNMLMTLSDGALQCANENIRRTRFCFTFTCYVLHVLPFCKTFPVALTLLKRETYWSPPEGTLWLEPEQTLA